MHNVQKRYLYSGNVFLERFHSNPQPDASTLFHQGQGVLVQSTERSGISEKQSNCEAQNAT